MLAAAVKSESKQWTAINTSTGSRKQTVFMKAAMGGESCVFHGDSVVKQN